MLRWEGWGDWWRSGLGEGVDEPMSCILRSYCRSILQLLPYTSATYDTEHDLSIHGIYRSESKQWQLEMLQLDESRSNLKMWGIGRLGSMK